MLRRRLREAVAEDRFFKCTTIYEIDDRTVAKRYFGEDQARHDWQMAQYAERLGVPVPGNFRFCDLTIDDKQIFYLAMNKAPGREFGELKAEEREAATPQFLDGLQRLFRAGIEPLDIHRPSNILYDPKHGVTLLDYEYWNFGENKRLRSSWEFIRRNLISNKRFPSHFLTNFDPF